MGLLHFPPHSMSKGLLFALGLSLSSSVWGDAEPRWPTDMLPPLPKKKERYHLFNPVPRSEMRPLNTDRPGRSTSPQTVDAGHVQLETDLVHYTTDRDPAQRTRSLSWFHVNARVGLSPSLEAQLLLPFYTNDLTPAPSDPAPGFGDGTLAVKWNVVGNGTEGVGLALMPQVSVRKERAGSRDREVEAELFVPLSFGLPLDLELQITPGFTFPREGNGVINLSRSLLPDLSGYAEYFLAKEIQEGSAPEGIFQFGFSYQLGADTQVDAGTSIGMTKVAADLSPFLGLTLRY